MKIYTPVDIDVKDLCANLDSHEALNLVKKIDFYMQDWEFTQDAILYLVESVKDLVELHPQYQEFLDELKESLK